VLTLYFAPGLEFDGGPHRPARDRRAVRGAAALDGQEGATVGRLPGHQPRRRVPTLVIDGRPLTEVSAILFFLARRFPEARLLPDDVEGQAQAISWMSFLAATVHPARRQGLDHAREVYAIADRRLGGRHVGVGRRLFGRRHSPLPPLLALRGVAESSRRGISRNLAAHHDRMQLRPAVRKTIEIETAIGYELPA
jgi:glutathione S-transferase